MLPPAKEQEAAFAELIRSSPEFIVWLLAQTKFSGLDSLPILVRSDNPWYRSKKTGKDSETDILIVFEVRNTRLRFALHFENKRKGDRFQPNQPELYQERAKDWMLEAKWGNYSDFQCVLIATQEFIDKQVEEVAKFDVIMSAESLAAFIPAFREKALSEEQNPN